MRGCTKFVKSQGCRKKGCSQQAWYISVVIITQVPTITGTTRSVFLIKYSARYEHVRGCGNVASLVLSLGYSWRWMVWTSHPERFLPVPNEKGEVGGVRDGLDSVGRRQNYSCCCWDANRSVPTPNPYPVTVPTTFSRLVQLYFGLRKRI